MKKWLYACVLAAGGLGCTKPNPALSCEDGLCSDSTVPFCDVTGSIGGEPNTCIQVSCTPNQFAECRGDKALICNATGGDYDLLTCSQGCSAEANGCKPEPPCETLDCKKHIIPKYLPMECDALATNGDLTISAPASLNTADTTMCTRLVTQPMGPKICVVHYHAITIEQSAILTVTGPNALALVADESMNIDGILDVSASGNTDGPGGGLTVSGGTQSGTKVGGGAGYRTVGAPGATSSTDGGANNGGAAGVNPDTLTNLFGGPRSDASGGYGGGGGGASTLISCRGRLTVSGSTDAGGGGGTPNDIEGINTIVPARGGGAGGTMVLQGMTMNLTGRFFANGGGGGGGNGTGGGTPGEDGQRSTSPALGGLDGGATRSGGYGGTENTPGPGSAPGGAGGGAAGYVLVYTPPSTTPLIAPVAQSPNLTIPTAKLSTN